MKLEEPDSLPITDITDIAVMPDGRIILVDRLSSEVRLHDANGYFLGFVGRRGEGPGEFINPLSVALLPSGFVVGEAAPHLSYFDRDGAFVRQVAIPGISAPVVETLGDTLGFVAAGAREASYWRGLASDSSTWRRVGARDSVIAETEEWRVSVQDHLALGPGETIVGVSLTYPLRRLPQEGENHTTFGSPPPSWEQASRPEPGPKNLGVLVSWLPSFTFIGGLHRIRDGHFVVSHARFVEGNAQRLTDLFRSRPTRMDVYDPNGHKLFEDLRLPGEVVAADSLLRILTSTPPDPWVMESYAPAWGRQH